MGRSAGVPARAARPDRIAPCGLVPAPPDFPPESHGSNPLHESKHVPFAEFQPSLRFLVDDLARYDEATLRLPGKTALAELTLLSLNFLPKFTPEEVPRAFDRWQDLLRAVDCADAPPLTPPMGRNAIDAIGWYALAVSEVLPEILSETFRRILHRPDDTIMSTLERTYQKGMAAGEARGEARGEAKGRAETLLRQLHKRFGSLDTTVEQRVRSGSPAELDAWTDRILDASSIAAVLDGSTPA